jgi:hypothetical protein
MFLHQVTENNNDRRCENLRDDRIPVKPLNKKFQNRIIEKEAGHIQQEIPEQLNSPFDIRPAEYHVLHQEKTDREIDKK